MAAMTLALLVAAVVVLLLLRVPVAFALLLPSLAYVLLTDGITLGVATQRVTNGLESPHLLAIPLFIMTGYLANATGVAERLFRFLAALCGPVRGSTGYVNVLSSVVFSWMSGAAIADAAGLGAVLVPAMRKRGYPESFALGLTGASAMIGPIMPPSIPAIVYAVTAGVSIGALFAAGVVPALVIAAVLCAYVWFYVYQRPGLDAQPIERKGLARTTLEALPVLGAPVIILGGILGGVFTPTEAAAAAVSYTLLLGVAYRTLTPAACYQVFLRTARTTGSIMLIVAAASLFGWITAREQAPQLVAQAIFGMTENPYVFLLLVNLFLLLLGMLLEPVAALLITVPVLMPVALHFQVSPLHLGVVMILNLVIGLLTPPVGLVLYVLGAVSGTPFSRVVRGVFPFLLVLLATLVVVTFVPQVSLWLPEALGLGVAPR
jgi:tripartite ATP-independent transporter DctM subunit